MYHAERSEIEMNTDGLAGSRRQQLEAATMASFTRCLPMNQRPRSDPQTTVLLLCLGGLGPPSVSTEIAGSRHLPTCPCLMACPCFMTGIRLEDVEIAMGDGWPTQVSGR